MELKTKMAVREIKAMLRVAGFTEKQVEALLQLMFLASR